MAVSAKDLIQAVSERQQATESRLSELAGTLMALEARLADLSPSAYAVAKEADNQVTPEMQVVIAAAVTAFLGKKVRLRSAKMLRSQHGVTNSWSQQGRMLIHASHNLRLRG